MAAFVTAHCPALGAAPHRQQGEGQPLHVLGGLEPHKIPDPWAVGMSESHWHGLNADVKKRSTCALSLPCLAASQARSWITSCIPALKRCQVRNLSTATPFLSLCCYFSLVSLFPHFCCTKVAHLTKSATVKISLWAQGNTPRMWSQQLAFIVSLINISAVKSKWNKQLFIIQLRWY